MSIMLMGINSLIFPTAGIDGAIAGPKLNQTTCTAGVKTAGRDTVITGPEIAQTSCSAGFEFNH